MKRTYKDSTELNPEPRGQYELYKGLGYTIPEALSDLIDNSIDANATEAMIRFIRTDKTLEAIQVIDNGEGIPANYIETAMQITYASNKTSKSLGKFGLGMKTASFALADRLTVVSRSKKDKPVGRCWDLETIKEENKWLLYELEKDEIIEQWLDPEFTGLNIENSGTIVHLDKIDKFSIGSGIVDTYLDTLIRKVEFHIGLHFHRFIEKKKINIMLSSLDQKTGKEISKTYVDPINPFPPKNFRGSKDYPKIHTYTMKSQSGKKIDINVKTHIWVPKSRKETFQLDDKQKRQGFYWYRNDRLIEAGGWADIVNPESHSNIARAEIDLPPALDKDFGLTVGKYKFRFPQKFQDNFFQKAKAPSGITIKDWRSEADKISRSGSEKAQKLDFFPKYKFKNKALNKNISKIFKNNGKKPVPIEIKWKDMSDETVIDVNFLDTEIVLNKKYKKNIEEKLKSSGMDILSLLIFTNVYEVIGKSKFDNKTQNKVEILNASFMELINNE